MKKISLIIFLLCILGSVYKANAQFVHERDFKPVLTKDFTDMEGTPYLYDEWIAGNVKLANGVTNNEPMLLKYNILTDQVTFKDKTGEEMAFVVPPKAFTLDVLTDHKINAKVYINGFANIDGSSSGSYFEMLTNGKVQLLKRSLKVILEHQDYGSASKTKTITDKTKYYMLIGGKAVFVKNEKKSILALLSDKQALLEEFIKQNKTNFKSDDDLAKLVNYYNSL